jgi:RHS repeat-associated protein
MLRSQWHQGGMVGGGLAGSIGSQVFPFIGFIERADEENTPPKAYLNWLVLDRRDSLVDFGYIRVTTDALENGTNGDHEHLLKDNLLIREPGFVYIYLSNENEDPVEVFFDDFKVEHVKSPVISMQDYYPFGLTFNSYEREKAIEQDYKFNGKEEQDELVLNWLDYGARMYDPAIARWMVVDPLADETPDWSPYTYAFDNPINFVDPDGMAAEPLEPYESTSYTLTMTYDKKTNTNTIVETSISSSGKFQTDADGNETWVESTTTSTATVVIDGDGEITSVSTGSTTVEKTYSTLDGQQAVSPFSSVPITAKGKLLNETTKPGGGYTPSNHLKNLQSTASQYIKAELGVTYNDRWSNMTAANMGNAGQGASGPARNVGKGISGISSAMSGGTDTEVYYREYSRNGHTSRSICNVPHDGKVPMSFHVYPAGKEFKK